MQKVITINLNGSAYQLDEGGYETLRAYLAQAEEELAGNPDRVEIMADLERAVADKCQKYLGAHKTVVTSSEIDQIVVEMGPVDGVGAEDAGSAGGSSAGGTRPADAESTATRRLYRITDGAMLAGVCNGLASYLRVDVTVVRIVFAILVLITKGFGALAYLVMMVVVPEAKTPQQHAATGGAPINAKEIVDRVKQQYAAGSKQWRRQWRQHQRQWQRRGWTPGMPLVYGPPPLAALLLPFFGLLHVALFLLMATMLISLVNTGAILDWNLPPDVPLWAGVLILLVTYHIVISPLRAVQQWTWHPHTGSVSAWFALWNAIGWVIGLAFVAWMGSNYFPEIREFLERLPELIGEFTAAVRKGWNR